jgi:hypothetical protein
VGKLFEESFGWNTPWYSKNSQHWYNLDKLSGHDRDVSVGGKMEKNIKQKFNAFWSNITMNKTDFRPPSNCLPCLWQIFYKMHSMCFIKHRHWL